MSGCRCCRTALTACTAVQAADSITVATADGTKQAITVTIAGTSDAPIINITPGPPAHLVEDAVRMNAGSRMSIVRARLKSRNLSTFQMLASVAVPATSAAPSLAVFLTASKIDSME